MDAAVLRRSAADRLPSVGRRRRRRRLGAELGEGDGGAGVEHDRGRSASPHVRGRDAAPARHRLRGQRGRAEPVRRRRSGHGRRPHSAAQCP